MTRHRLFCLSLICLFMFPMYQADAASFLDRIRERRAGGESQGRSSMLQGHDEESSYYLNFEGHQRGYELYIPASVKPTPSLMIVFHGGMGSATRIMNQTNMQPYADREGFIIAYPNGLNGRWSDGRNTTEGSNDVNYIRALIEELVKTQHINRNAVFVTGPSNGGAMSHRMACEASDVIAGFAPVVANMSVDLYGKCRPTRPTPIIMFMGKDDNLMPFNGGKSEKVERFHDESGNGVLSFEQTKNFWLRNNGCSNEMENAARINHDPDDGTVAIPMLFNHCSGNVKSHFYVIEGGGHNWPGGKDYSAGFIKRIIGNVSQEIDASATMVQFFQSYGL